MERRLAAILATDVVGYSRLIRADEEGTIAALKVLRADLIDPKIEAHHGRVVKLMGDGMLAEFPSVANAVQAAVETQQAVAEHNSGLPKDKRIGAVVEGEGQAETAAFCIHAPIHLRHGRANAVLHTHMSYATTLTSLEDGRLEPVTQNTLRFHNDVAYDDDYSGVAEGPAEGARMAGVLGDKRVLFLAHHGVVVVGKTVAQAFDDLYYLERACEVQVLAMSTGRPLKCVLDAEAPGYAQ